MFDYAIHEKYMKKIIKDIFSHEIGKSLWFKGGTLVYLVHHLDRFSTDVDLDLLDSKQEQEVIETMRNILPIHGEIKNKTLGKTIHRRILRYDEKSMNIKIELNKRVWTNNTYEPQYIDGIAIQCMTPDCIFANKLVALSERWYPRDLYDVYFFFCKNFSINEMLITERTWLSLKDFFHKLNKDLPIHFTETNILIGLGEVLTDQQKIWSKANLLKEVQQILNAFA